MAAIKVPELIGVPSKGFEDAVRPALQQACESARGIAGADVISNAAKIENDRIAEYHSAIKFAFWVEEAR